MGIGCRRDPLEANVWYVKAADQGDERAKHRLAAIRAAASGDVPTSGPGKGKMKKSAAPGVAGGNKDEKECIVM
jgi:TPR repeat protein